MQKKSSKWKTSKCSQLVSPQNQDSESSSNINYLRSTTVNSYIKIKTPLKKDKSGSSIRNNSETDLRRPMKSLIWKIQILLIQAQWLPRCRELKLKKRKLHTLGITTRQYKILRQTTCCFFFFNLLLVSKEIA